MRYRIEKIDLSPASLADFASAIRRGEQQAVTQKELTERWGCSDRAVRVIIAEIRKKHIGDGVLVASDKGYFYTDNTIEIRRWIVTAKKKAHSLEEIVLTTEDFLSRLEGAS